MGVKRGSQGRKVVSLVVLSECRRRMEKVWGLWACAKVQPGDTLNTFNPLKPHPQPRVSFSNSAPLGVGGGSPHHHPTPP